MLMYMVGETLIEDLRFFLLLFRSNGIVAVVAAICKLIQQ